MDYAGLRDRMVRDQVEARGVKNPDVLRIMRTVPRHRFVDPALAHSAYGDAALPIGFGQTISQPYMVGLMTSLLEVNGRSRVLEIGTGSGYQAAVLSRLVHAVFTVERVEPLAQRAQSLLRELGYENVLFRVGDGTVGWRKYAPYDAIIVTAGAPDPPPSLFEQLREGGRLVVPAGPREEQRLLVLERGADGSLRERATVPCTFVPLIGREGWSAPDAEGSTRV